MMRAYDPMYVRPDDLHTVPVVKALRKHEHAVPGMSKLGEVRPINPHDYAIPIDTLPSPDPVTGLEEEPQSHMHSPEQGTTRSARTRNVYAAYSTCYGNANIVQTLGDLERLAFEDTYYASVLSSSLQAYTQEYEDFSRLPPRSRPTRGYIPPSQFARSMFEKERRAFSSLKSLQGQVLPKVLGHYHIEYPQREYIHDRVVYVTLFEHVEGVPLSPAIISSLTDDEANSLWELIHASLMAIHQKGVIHRNRVLRKILWNTELSRITWMDFTQSAITSDMKVEQTAAGKDSDLAVIFNRFEEAMNLRVT